MSSPLSWRSSQSGVVDDVFSFEAGDWDDTVATEAVKPGKYDRPGSDEDENVQPPTKKIKRVIIWALGTGNRQPVST